MRILILTSCTGKKKSKPKNQLTIEDFRVGNEHLNNRIRLASIGVQAWRL